MAIFIQPVGNLPFSASSYWLDWLAIFGYITFACFIVWRVLMPRSDD